MRFLIVGLASALLVSVASAQQAPPQKSVVVLVNQEFAAGGKKYNIPRGAILGVLREKGDVIEAPWQGHLVSIAKQAVVPYDKAIEFFTAELKRKPNVYDYHVRGQLHSALGSPRKAIADFTEALRLDPESGVLYHDRGNEWLRLGQLDAALADFNKALKIQAHPDVYAARAQAWEAKGDTKKSIADLSEAIRLDGKFVTAYIMRAQAFQALGEYRRALPDAETALKLNPRHPDGHPLRGAALSMLGEYDKASAAFAQGLKLYPKYPGTLNALAWFLATSPSASHRDGARAVDLANQACKASEFKDAMFLDTLAAASAEAGDFARAVQWQQKVVSMPGPPKLREVYRQRLELYKSKKPFRDRP